MMPLFLEWLTQALMISSALLSGIYLVFSNTIMPVLGRLDAATGITTMQAINRRIQNPLFFALFFGSPLAAVLLLAMQALNIDVAHNVVSFSAASLAIAAFLSTLLVNVPMNERLDRAEPRDERCQQIWQTYLLHWSRWNTLRAVCLAVSALMLTL